MAGATLFLLLLFVENIDTAFALVDDVHAVSDITLVHKGLAFLENLTLKLLHEVLKQVLTVVAKEGYPEF